MLIKKKILDLILIEPWPKRQNPKIWVKEIKKDRIAVSIAQKLLDRASAIRLPLILKI